MPADIVLYMIITPKLHLDTKISNESAKNNGKLWEPHIHQQFNQCVRKNIATTQNLIGIDRKYSMSPIHIIALAYDINEVHHGV